MLSDKGLKLQWGGASTVGAVFPPEVMTIVKPACVRVLLHTCVWKVQKRAEPVEVNQGKCSSRCKDMVMNVLFPRMPIKKKQMLR